MLDYPNILVVFLTQLNEGFEFQSWPHHITVLPWFKADAKALESIKALAEEALPLHAQLTDTAMFGHRKEIPVRLVESEELVQLHMTLLRDRSGVLGLINSRFTMDEFRPHVTLHGNHDPTEGDISINQLTLVKKLPQGKLKRIERVYE